MNRAKTYEDYLRSGKKPIPFCVYDRHSSTMQDSDTAELRQSGCRKYADQNGIHIVEIFADAGKSGQQTAGRARYQALLAEALGSNRRFAGVLVFHSSRWGRGDDAKLDFLTLQMKGVKIVSVTEPLFQDEGPEGSLVRGMLQEVAAYQSRQLGTITRSLQSGNAARGFLNGGMTLDGFVKVALPMGIKNQRGEERFRYRLELDPNPGRYDTNGLPRWQWIRTAADLVLKEGKGLKTTAQALRALGWRQKSADKPLGPSHVRSAILNPIYTGRMVWNRRRWRKAQGKRLPTLNSREAWVWSEPSHPEVISKAEFDALASRFTVVSKPTTRVRRQLLAGLLECAKCGSHMVINSRCKRGKEFCYLICGGKQRNGWKSCAMPPLPMEAVEVAVERIVLDLIIAPEVVVEFLTRFQWWLKERASAGQKGGKEAQDEAARLEREIGNLVSAIAGGATGSSLLAGEVQKREVRLASLKAEGAAAAVGLAGETVVWHESRLQDWTRAVRRIYLTMDRDGRRSVLQHVVKKIVVMNKREGRVIFDPASLLTLRNYFSELPAEEPFRIKIGCGGWI